MNKNKFSCLQAVSVMLLLFILNSCETKKNAESTENKMKSYGFFVKGVSGKDVFLDRTWYRECVQDGNGGWMKSMRTMSGTELSTTIINYQNNSAKSNCDSGASMITIFVQTLTYDKAVPITWTDGAGKPSAPPPGLENVKEGNGATGIVTYATCTPLSKSQADGLNYVKFAGHTDWSVGVTKDILPYFTEIGPAKGTIVVDDRTDTGAVYDGISVNPKEYPTLMPNITPHKGPLNKNIIPN